MFEHLIKSRKSKRGAGSTGAAAAKAPPGYSLAPGSKKGLYRKRKGDHWEYYDPTKAKGGSAVKMQELAKSAKAAPAALQSMLKAVALGNFAAAAKAGMAYKQHHHKIDELIDLLHVVDVAAAVPIHEAAHAVAGIAHTAMSFAMGGADKRALRKGGDDDDDEEKEEAARDKKIEAANNEGAEDDEDDGDEDAAEERKERARDSFNASMSFGALIYKCRCMARTPELARAEATYYGRELLAARQREGRPGDLAQVTGERHESWEMEEFARKRQAALERAEELEGLDGGVADAMRGALGVMS